MDIGPSLPVVKPDTGWAPSACTLPRAEQPLRVAEFADLFTAAVRGLNRTGTESLRLRLDPTPPVAARTADLMARESACCALFTFALVSSGGELWLDITVPTGQSDVLDALAGLAA